MLITRPLSATTWPAAARCKASCRTAVNIYRRLSSSSLPSYSASKSRQLHITIKVSTNRIVRLWTSQASQLLTRASPTLPSRRILTSSIASRPRTPNAAAPKISLPTPVTARANSQISEAVVTQLPASKPPASSNSQGIATR